MRRLPGSPGGNSTTTVIACAPAGMNGGSTSCSTVIASCHAPDRGFFPAAIASTSGMRNTPVENETRGPLTPKVSHPRRL